MPRRELDTGDPNVAFGQDQALFTYNMASSLTRDTNRPIIDRAHDAVHAAIRLFERPEIEVELATSGLIAVLERDITVDERKIDRI